MFDLYVIFFESRDQAPITITNADTTTVMQKVVVVSHSQIFPTVL